MPLLNILGRISAVTVDSKIKLKHQNSNVENGSLLPAFEGMKIYMINYELLLSTSSCLSVFVAINPCNLCPRKPWLIINQNRKFFTALSTTGYERRATAHILLSKVRPAAIRGQIDPNKAYNADAGGLHRECVALNFPKLVKHWCLVAET